MKRMIVVLTIFLSGCATLKYPGWERVRVESDKPNQSCEYKAQGVCGKYSAKCFFYFKKRAVRADANTVVITTEISDDPMLMRRKPIFADYYDCRGSAL